MWYLLIFILYSATACAEPSSAGEGMSFYPSNQIVSCETYVPTTDPGRVRDEKVFGRQYGDTSAEVRKKLSVVYWMPHYFGRKYPLYITTVNHVDRKVAEVSNRLEQLVKQHPDYLPYLDHPSGAFYWRHIQNTARRSPHSYGIAIDLNTEHTNYWVWDTGIKENEINQVDHFAYKNTVPCAIVSIFERAGFIWGGKWMHYDTMHFEYRPEMFHDKN